MPSLHLLPLVAWDEVFKALHPKIHRGRTPRIEGGEILQIPTRNSIWGVGNVRQCKVCGVDFGNEAVICNNGAKNIKKLHK